MSQLLRGPIALIVLVIVISVGYLVIQIQKPITWGTVARLISFLQ